VSFNLIVSFRRHTQSATRISSIWPRKDFCFHFDFIVRCQSKSQFSPGQSTASHFALSWSFQPSLKVWTCSTFSFTCKRISGRSSRRSQNTSSSFQVKLFANDSHSIKTCLFLSAHYRQKSNQQFKVSNRLFSSVRLCCSSLHLQLVKISCESKFSHQKMPEIYRVCNKKTQNLFKLDSTN
jgi:hypothetical protein